MKNIRQILVPTDFSAPAANALAYAFRLAELVKAPVKVLHVYTFVPNPTAPFLETYTPPLSDFENIYKERITEFVTEVRKKHVTEGGTDSLDITTEVVPGFAADEIIEQSAQKSCSLIVMGMTGENFLLKSFFGTISQKVSHEAQCPVLLVPQKAQFVGIERLMYAVNEDSVEKFFLEEAVSLAQLFGAMVHFVNINEYVIDPKPLQAQIMEDLFEHDETKIAFEFHAIHSLNVVGELNNYAHLHKISLMAFATKQRGWFSSLFHSSLTDEMADNTDLPLLVLHKEDH